MVRPYRPSDAGAWDELVGRAWNGTFLHSRRYLAYHGDRFCDASWVVERRDGHLAAVLPAANHPQRDACVVSHPGITFGGLVHDGSLRGSAIIDVLVEIGRGLGDRGIETLVYKAVPGVYHRVPACDDLYALFRLGASRSSCTITATVPLDARPQPTDGRRLALRRAESRQVTIALGARYLPEFWEVLEASLRLRHGAVPVHTLAEITSLMQAFPEQIRCVVALQNDRVVAGLVLFTHPTVTHVQYMASSEAGRVSSAVDLAVSAAVDIAEKAGCRYFDFGTSNEEGGRVLNDSLFWFKTSFGAGSFVHETYDMAVTGLGEAGC